MTFLLDHRTIKEVEEMTGYRVSPCQRSLHDSKDAIGWYYGMAVVRLQDLDGGFPVQGRPALAYA
jgi:hypothetical protein